MMPRHLSESADRQISQTELRAMRLLLPLGLAIAAAAVFFARFHGGSGVLYFYDVNFFYYLRIAQHIAAGHHSTFDGTHLTNGYHPLWRLGISGLVLFCGTG